MSARRLIIAALSFGLGALLHYLFTKLRARPKAFDLATQLVRNRQFFGAGQDRIQASFVIVVGLGGVGSHCVMSLARAGVRKLRLIDFDDVSISSLNRNAVACTEDVGFTKAATLAKYIRRIIPQCEVDPLKALFSLDEASTLLGGNPSFVVDCIDNTNTKEQLITYCVQHNIPIVSSGGAGGRIDPTRLEIGDISTTKNCELIKKIRRGLHLAGIHRGITMVFSADHARRPLLENRDAKTGLQEEHDPVAKFRTRIMPVIGTMPAIAGNAIAAHVLSKLGGVEFVPLHKDNIHKDTLLRCFDRFLKLEKHRFGNDCHLDAEDFENVCRDLWKWRSAFSGVHTYVDAVRWELDSELGAAD
jgi:tRNA threonylcarbamoyladenosine dehydratase